VFGVERLNRSRLDGGRAALGGSSSLIDRAAFEGALKPLVRLRTVA